jgi:hypothetical protein
MNLFPEIVVGILLPLAVRLAWKNGRATLSRRAQPPTPPTTSDDHAERLRGRLIASCVLLVVISVPLIFHFVPPNGIYGFRTGATRSSPAIWYAANAFMGWTLSIAAVLSVTFLLILPRTTQRWLVWAAFYIPFAAAVVLSFAYLSRLSA